MIRTVAIVIPADNEEAVVGHCLDAVALARRHAERHLSHAVDIRTVVVLDRCVDATERAANARADVETIVCDAGRVGVARAQGVEHVLADSRDVTETWIANTDADSRVPTDWITRMVEEADRGAHLVLGTVLPGDGLSPLRRRLWRELHHLGDDHPHIHGANFGIRADTYKELGGWPPLACGEDVALATLANTATDLKTVSTGAIPVLTSARLSGRAPRGFASYLRALVVPEWCGVNE